VCRPNAAVGLQSQIAQTEAERHGAMDMSGRACRLTFAAPRDTQMP